MASAIDASKPVEGAATTASVRANFAAAKSEIEELQNSISASMVLRERGPSGLNDRFFNMDYTNGTTAPIYLNVSIFATSTGPQFQLLVEGLSVARFGELNAKYDCAFTKIYPGETYQLKNLSGTGTISNWTERGL